MSRKPNSEEIARIIKKITKTLYSAKCWGTGHMLVVRLKSGLPGHLRGDVDAVLDFLIKQGIICVYGRTKHGLAIYLNQKRMQDIEKILSDSQSRL